MGAHYNHLAEAILMSTHNIGFYEDLTKISNRHLISSSDYHLLSSVSGLLILFCSEYLGELEEYMSMFLVKASK